jgi:hypothetical protein
VKSSKELSKKLKTTDFKQMEMVEPFHLGTCITWKCCSSSSSSSSSSDNDNNDDNMTMMIIVEEDMKERGKKDEVRKDQKEKKKEKICLIFIKQNCSISIHI